MSKQISRNQQILNEKLPQWQKSPILFIKDMWNLIPQPIKPEYQTAVEIITTSKQFDQLRAEWFEPFIRGEHLTYQQWAIFLALESAIRGESSRRISTSSGHGIGKSCSTSIIVIWRLFCHFDAQIACTAPTSKQLFDVLWKEISVWIRRMPAGWHKMFDCQSTYVRMTESPSTWFASAKTAKKDSTEALAGVHGEHVMVLADEASGVPHKVFNTMEGSLTEKDIFVLMFSNPTRLSGYFYDSHNHPKLKSRWQRLTFSNIDSPIVRDDYNQDIIDQHGENSDEYRIRVLGQFPKADSVDEQGYSPLLSKDEIKEIDLPHTSLPEWVGTTIMGIDPAGDGADEAIWVIRDQFKALIVKRSKKSDKFSISNITRTLAKIHDVKPSNIYLDSFGVGADSAVELAKDNFRINDVNVGDASLTDKGKGLYLNRRAENFWRLRTAIKSGFSLYRDKIWRDEVTFIPFRRNARNRIQIMPKKDIKKNYGRSPDSFDALMMTFSSERSGADLKTFTSSQRRNNQQIGQNPTIIRSTMNNLHSAL